MVPPTTNPLVLALVEPPERLPPPLDDDLRVEAAKRYVEILDQVTGAEFVGDSSEPASRISKALGL